MQVRKWYRFFIFEQEGSLKDHAMPSDQRLDFSGFGRPVATLLCRAASFSSARSVRCDSERLHSSTEHI